MMEELKPCPFCGEKAVTIVDDGGNNPYYFPGCSNRCDMGMDEATWNARPIEDALRAENASLREQLEQAQKKINILLQSMIQHGRTPGL